MGSALCFAMTSHEKTLLSRYYQNFESVSLFGTYGRGHTTGVDARDLGRYPVNSFGAHYSCLLFDYFIEHEKALAEAFRVLAPGGLFITHLEGPRIEEGLGAPRVVRNIVPRPGYYEYIPDGSGMVSIKVGKEWFLQAMRRAGFEDRIFQIVDEPSGMVCEWFVGVKPAMFAAETEQITRRSRADTPPQSTDAVRVLATSLDEQTAQTRALADLYHQRWCIEEGFKRPEHGPKLEYVSGRRPTQATALGSSVRSKEYSIPIRQPGFPFGHVTATLSIPVVDDNPKSIVRFSEHVGEQGTGGATERVIACSVGGYYVSDDLGVNWRWIPVKGFEKVRFVNSVSLPDGTVCLQSKGLSPKLPRDEQPHAGLIVTLASDGTIRTATAPSVNQWHGSSSVDFRDGVLLFCDYALNAPRGSSTDDERFPSAVWRSVDFGGSWKKVLECSGEEIRHFHTVRADPFASGTWYLTSGDLPSEINIFVSHDHGQSWRRQFEPSGDASMARFRMTDMAFTAEGMIWGSDDILGSPTKMNHDLPLAGRSGARMFFAPRNDIGRPIDIGYLGQAVRSIVDLGVCWLVITQGSIYQTFTRPAVFLLTKQKPYAVQHLFDVDNYSDLVTGFTYSCASRAAKDGTFFTVRGAKDVFDAPFNILKWRVRFN